LVPSLSLQFSTIAIILLQSLAAFLGFIRFLGFYAIRPFHEGFALIGMYVVMQLAGFVSIFAYSKTEARSLLIPFSLFISFFFVLFNLRSFLKQKFKSPKQRQKLAQFPYNLIMFPSRLNVNFIIFLSQLMGLVSILYRSLSIYLSYSGSQSSLNQSSAQAGFISLFYLILSSVAGVKGSFFLGSQKIERVDIFHIGMGFANLALAQYFLQLWK
jgi:hypothetical protein